MKGLILAGGSRHPIASDYARRIEATVADFDKPMIYYPLSVLMLGRYPRNSHHHYAGR